MMKSIKTALVLALAMCFGTSYSQYYYNYSLTPGNPGTQNTDDGEFPLGSGLDASWIEILGSGQASAAWSPNQTLPFPFDFNGSAVTAYKVSSSGVLTFDVAAGTAPGYGSISSLPNAGVPDMSVVVGGLEGSGTNDAIVTQTFGSPGNQQHWTLFASYTPTGASLWSYWSIVLEEGTNNIYFVDQRCNGTIALTLGVQIDAATGYQVAGTVDTQGDNLADRSDNYYFAFYPGTRPAEDISGIDVALAPYLVSASAPFTIDGDLVNFGGDQVTSFDLNYSVNGGATVTDPISGTSINTFDVYGYTSPTTWTPAAAGLYTIDVWASSINGNADQNTANDIASVTVEVVDDFTQRTPLYEMFTSSTCGPCVQGNIDLEELFDNNPDQYTSVKYQMSWPGAGDPYFTDEGQVRRSYYNVSGVPRLEIDGAWDANPNSIPQSAHDDAFARPAFAEIEATYFVSGQTVDISIDVTPIADVSSNNLVLHVAVIEWLTENNQESNGETEFLNVMKKMLPDAGGQSIPALSVGNVQSFTESYTFNGSYRLPNDAADQINHASEHSIEEFTDLSVVVWIQNDGDKDVIQSAYADLATSTEEYTNIAGSKLYPNPTSDLATVMVHTMEAQPLQIEVYNILGGLVISEHYGVTGAGRQTHDLNTQALNNGIYMVRIISGTSVEERKLMIQR
jgi:hypothetical protein